MKKYLRSTIKFYDSNIDEYYKKTIKLQDKKWLKKFTKLLPNQSKVLDIGCGFGRDCKYFSQHDFDTYGIDLSKEMIKKAKQFDKNSNFQVMDMLDLGFDDNHFSGIWCSATLLHLNKKDAKKSLKEMYRVLKSNGTLYINLKEGVGEKIIKDKRYQGVDKFYSYYKEEEIKKLLAKNDFELVDFSVEYSKNEYKNTGIIYLITKKI